MKSWNSKSTNSTSHIFAIGLNASYKHTDTYPCPHSHQAYQSLAPSAWMMLSLSNLFSPFLNPFLALATSAKRYWVIPAERQSVGVLSQVDSKRITLRRLPAERSVHAASARTGDVAHPPLATQSPSPKQEVEHGEAAECPSPTPNAFAISRNSRSQTSISGEDHARSE
jgi:hypothetical protein